MRELIGQQGEVRILKIDKIPEGLEMKPVDRTNTGFIVSHSENGNHHVLVGGEVMEKVQDVPEGMRILYGIVKEPTKFRQDAANPHDCFDLEPGIYEFRVSREYNPFADQARIVAD